MSHKKEEAIKHHEGSTDEQPAVKKAPPKAKATFNTTDDDIPMNINKNS